MKIEDQVVNIELAKGLKELGVSQDSVWVWIKSLCIRKGYECRLSWNVDPYLENYSAYTVAELGELIPFFVSTSKRGGIPSLGYRCTFSLPPQEVHYEECDNEADARAKMLIYLIREGVIKGENIK